MKTEVDSHLRFCWDVVGRDRESYSLSFKEFLDKIFLKRLDKCDFVRLDIDDLESDLNRLAKAVDDIRYFLPHKISEGN